ncbi:hypothetical protein [Haladaptatus sp. NG-SE-30]
MPLRTIRETGETLRESRDAIREGRVAIGEARVELEIRYARLQRRVDGIKQAVELLQADGTDTDVERLLSNLDGQDDRVDPVARVSPPRRRAKKTRS